MVKIHAVFCGLVSKLITRLATQWPLLLPFLLIAKPTRVPVRPREWPPAGGSI